MTRYFIPCPQFLRVQVSPESLERWTIDWNSLARSTGSALALGGECTQLIADRLWRLGRVKWQGTYRDALLARGITWPDGRDIVQQIAHATRPIGFVGDIPPPNDAWAGRVPPVVRLSQVSSLADGMADVDGDAVLAGIFLADDELSSGRTFSADSQSLTLMIRRQIKAEGKSHLTDDILLEAYRQEGSVRKAAAFVSESTGQAVTKDKVLGAVPRSGGMEAVISPRIRRVRKRHTNNVFRSDSPDAVNHRCRSRQSSWQSCFD